MTISQLEVIYDHDPVHSDAVSLITKILCCAPRSDEFIPHLVCYRRPCSSLSDLQGPQDHTREVQRAKGSQTMSKVSLKMQQVILQEL